MTKEDLFEKGEEFLSIFKRGAEFTRELLADNERLRFKAVELEEKIKTLRNRPVSRETEELQREIERLKKEKEELLERYRQVEAENKDFANRYVEVEEENNNLANLYIASYQLHSTLDHDEVIQIVMEIIINLIGAEVFGIFLVDPKLSVLKPVSMEGIDPAKVPDVKPGEGIVGQVTQSGESYFVDDLSSVPNLDTNRPLVCIPLKIKEKNIGVIVIYKLLEQKKQFVNVDYELFTLLAGHAATAIFSSRLYSDSERKRSTMQGFIELLTK